MEKIFDLVSSPFKPPIEIAFDTVFKLHAPYSDSFVTIMVSPNITGYEEGHRTNVRQLIITGSTQDTKFLSFNSKNNTHTIEIEGKILIIELLRISKLEQGRQKFHCFKFRVTQ